MLSLWCSCTNASEKQETLVRLRKASVNGIPNAVVPSGSPTLYRFGIGHLASVGKQAVVDAIKFLERCGFITKQRRTKRIQTPFGAKVVQDTNAYTIHGPRELGAIARQIFGRRSESWDAASIISPI
jgi:hypothetical protein